MALVVDGSANKTIAAKLGIQLRTVELHVSRLLYKSGAARRAELAAMFWSQH